MSYIVNLSWHDIDGQTDGMSNIQPDEVNGELSETLNDIDYFDFVVYYGQQNWAYFEPNQTFVDLWSIKQSKDVFNGRCVAVTKEMTNDGILSKRIHCESEMAYLCDSVGDVNDILLHMRTYYPATTEEKEQYGDDYVRFDRFIMSLLSLHTTSTADVKRRIYANDCTWNSGGYFEPVDPTIFVYPPTDITQSIDIDTGSSWSVLKDLRDRLGYDIWIVHEDGHIVLKIGYSGAHMDTHYTPINLGENMQSLRVETSPQEYGKVTRIVPLGSVGANGLRLTIADVNDHERWLTNTASRAIEAKTGIIQKVVVYEDLVDDGNLTADEARAIRLELMRRGTEELSKLTTGITGITCRAVDLYELNVANKYPYQIGGNYPFYCPYLGLNGDDGIFDSYFRLTRRVTDLGKPYDPELTFALPSATYRTQATDERIRVAQKLYALQKSQADRMDSTSIKRTTSAAYDPTTANPDTVYYVDKGNGTGELMLDGTSYGGGGASTTVENAAILTDDTFSDYAVDNELIVNLEPDGHIYYGLDTGQVGMCIVQGRYCVWGVSGGSVKYNDGVWTIFGSTNLYNTIINNIDKLSSQHGNYDESHPELGGGWLFNGVSNKSYPERCKQLEYRIGTATRSAQGISYSANIFIRNYLNDAPTGDWWEEDLTHTNPASIPTREHSAAPIGPTNTRYFQDRLTDVVMIPVVTSYNPATSYSGLQTPYGYVSIPGILIFAQDGSNGWGAIYIEYTASLGVNDLYMPYTPLISEAEKAFLLGITKKTEPIPGA